MSRRSLHKRITARLDDAIVAAITAQASLETASPELRHAMLASFVDIARAVAEAGDDLARLDGITLTPARKVAHGPLQADRDCAR